MNAPDSLDAAAMAYRAIDDVLKPRPDVLRVLRLTDQEQAIDGAVEKLLPVVVKKPETDSEGTQ